MANENGIGLSLDVVLSPTLNKQVLTQETTSALNNGIDRVIHDLTVKSQEVSKSIAPLKKLVSALSQSSKSIRNDSVSKTLLQDISALESLVKNLGKAGSRSEFNDQAVQVSNRLASLAAMSETLAPKLTSTKKSSTRRSQANEAKRIHQTLDKKIKEFNIAVTKYEAAFGDTPKNASPFLKGRRVDTTSMSIKTYHSSVERENARHISVLKVQNETIAKLERSLPQHGGLALDIETANMSKNNLWAVASKSRVTALGTLTRDLQRDKVELSKFHKAYAQNMKMGGQSLEDIVESVYSQYAATNKTGNLKGQLTPFIGHNNQFDIEGIRNAADRVNTKNSKELANAMTRLMPNGDSYELAKQGDTAQLFASFMRNTMGMSNYKMPGQAGGMGNTLGAASAAFGYKLVAHDPASDTAATDFLYRLLKNKPEIAKKLYNRKAHIAQAEKDTYDQLLRQAVSSEYGKDNLHLASLQSLPASMEGATPLGALRAQAEFEMNKRSSSFRQTLGEKSSAGVHLGGAVGAEYQRKKYNELTKKAQDLILNSVDKAMAGKGPMSEAEFGREIANVMTSKSVSEALGAAAGVTGNREKVKKELTRAAIDSYALMGRSDAITSKKSLASEFNMSKMLGGAFGGVYDDHATGPVVGPKTQWMEKGLLRISSLAQVFNDWGGAGGHKTMDELSLQYNKGRNVISPPKNATDLGNAFEIKAMEALGKRSGINLTKTLENQLTLQLGEGVTGHPDGFMYNTKTGIASLVEAKYRGSVNQEKMDRGQVPAAYRAQASAYALAAGLPNLPTTFITGGLVAENAATDRIDRMLQQNISVDAEAELKAERERVMPKKIEDYRLSSDFSSRTVMPDKEMQARIKEAIPAITGKNFDPHLISGLPEDVLNTLAGGKKLSTEELNKALKKAQASLINMSKKTDSVTISMENLGNGIVATTPTGGGDDTIKSWNPRVSSTKQEQLASAEKLYEKSRTRYRELGVRELGYREYIKGKKSTGLEEDAKFAQLAETELADVQKNRALEKMKAQGLQTGLKRMRSGMPASRVDDEAEFRMRLQMEKDALTAERRQLAVKLRADGGKYATSKDIQRNSDLNSVLSRMHGVNVGKDVGTAELSKIAQKQGLEIGGGGGGGGSKGKGGKDFVGGAIDLLDWQIQWMAGVTVLNAISGAFKNSVGFAIEFEAAMKNVQLITQANTAEMDLLTGNLKDLTSTFQYSAIELGQGLIVLGQAGFTAAESLHILPAVTALATATLSDLKTATDITTTAIKAFNIPVEETAKIVNTLASMTIESKLDIEKLGTSFNYIASTASAAGFSLEETGTAMGLMSNAGVRASTIGTTLRSVIGSLLHPTKKFESALASVGLSVEEVSPKYNSLGEIFKTLRAAGFDVETAFQGLDKRIAGGAITLVHSADQFDSFEASITGTNRAFDMAVKQMDTFNAQTKRMKNIGQLIGNDLFSSSLGPLKDVAKLFNSVLEAMLKISEAVPDSVKAVGVSVGGLTIGTSLASGVARGVWDVGSNVRAARKKEDLVLAPGDKRGSTLTGRNKQVYSMYSTFFSPQMLAASAAFAVSAYALSKAYSELSGEAEILRRVEIKDKFIAEGVALDAAVAALDRATGSTVNLIKAKKELKALGVTDITPIGLENAQIKKEVDARKAEKNVFKARVTAGKQLFGTALKPKEEGQIAKDFLVSQNKYWSGDEATQQKALGEIGLTLSSKGAGEFYTMQQTDKENPKFDAFRLSEAKKRLLSAGKNKRRLDLEISNKTQTPAQTAYYEEVRAQMGTPAITPMDEEKRKQSLARLRAAAHKSVTARYGERGAARSEFKAAMENYDAAGGVTSLDRRMSGSAREAKRNFKLAQKAVADQKAIIAGTEALKGSDSSESQAFLKLLKEELIDLETQLKIKNKKQAIKGAFVGQPRSYEKLAFQFQSFLTKGDGAMDVVASKQFRGLSTSSLASTGEALIDLKDKQQVEEARIKEYFDGKVPLEVQASLDLKFKIQSRELIQAEKDKAFAPLQKIYNSLIEQNKAAHDFAVKNLESDSKLTEAAIGTNSFNARMKGIQSKLTFGKNDSNTLFGGYDKAAVGFAEDKNRLANKRKLDKAMNNDALNLAKETRDKEMQAFTMKNGSIENLTKTQAERLYSIQLKYSQKVIALSRSRRVALEGDLKAVQALAEKQAQNVNDWKSGKQGVTHIFDSISKEAKNKLNPKSSKEIIRDKFKAASNSEFAAEKALQGGDKTGAKAAAGEAARLLKEIMNDPNASKRDISKVKKTAAAYSNYLGSGYDVNINKAEASLSDTNNILEKILGALTGTDLEGETNTKELLDGKKLVGEAKLSELEQTQLVIGKAMMQGGEDFASAFLSTFEAALPKMFKKMGLGANQPTEDTSTATEQKGSVGVDITLNSDLLTAQISNTIVNDLTPPA